MIYRNIIPNHRFMKQKNPIKGLKMVPSNPSMENLPQVNHIRNQSLIGNQNNIIIINENNNGNNNLNEITPDNFNNVEINIDAD